MFVKILISDYHHHLSTLQTSLITNIDTITMSNVDFSQSFMMELKLNFTLISAVVKTIATGFCVFFFIRNAEYNYKMFNKGNTINTINMRDPGRHWTGPPMPWIVFCLKTPFKDSSKILLTPDDFISNTFDPQENVGNITYFLSSGNTDQQVGKGVYSFFNECTYM